MPNFKDNLKAFINPALITKVANLLGEKESDITNASSSIISSLMGIMLKRGHSPYIKNLLKEAGNLDLWADVNDIFEGNLTREQQHIGDDFLQHLVGDKASDLTDPIAANTGLSNIATNRLISILAPLFAAYIGKKIVKESISTSALFEEIEAEKKHFMGLIPQQVIKTFRLDHESQDKKRVEEKIQSESATPTSDSVHNTHKLGYRYNWLKWLIPLLLLLFAFFCWRSCKKESSNSVEYIQEEIIIVDTISN